MEQYVHMKWVRVFGTNYLSDEGKRMARYLLSINRILSVEQRLLIHHSVDLSRGSLYGSDGDAKQLNKYGSRKNNLLIGGNICVYEDCKCM